MIKLLEKLFVLGIIILFVTGILIKITRDQKIKENPESAFKVGLCTKRYFANKHHRIAYVFEVESKFFKGSSNLSGDNRNILEGDSVFIEYYLIDPTINNLIGKIK